MQLNEVKIVVDLIKCTLGLQILSFFKILALSQFSKESNKFCNDRLPGIFDSRHDAEVACVEMQSRYGNCTTINDNDCDDDLYRICKSGFERKKSEKGSCIYHRGAQKTAFTSLYEQL